MQEEECWIVWWHSKV